jgi:hypothetical protein
VNCVPFPLLQRCRGRLKLGWRWVIRSLVRSSKNFWLLQFRSQKFLMKEKVGRVAFPFNSLKLNILELKAATYCRHWHFLTQLNSGSTASNHRFELGLEHEYGKAKTSSGKFAPQYAESKNAI